MDNHSLKEAVSSPVPERPMRICILSHAARGTGAISVCSNLILHMTESAPQHTYFVTIPDNPIFEKICGGIPHCETLIYKHDRGGFARRWLWETFKLPNIVNDFRPEVILALCDRGLIDPPCPQAILVHRPYLFYPSKHYGNDTLTSRIITGYYRRHLKKSLRKTQLLLCQTSASEQRLRDTYKYTGRTAICPNAVSPVTAAEKGTKQLPDSLVSCASKMKLFCLTSYYSHKNIEGIIEMFRKFPNELQDVVVITTLRETDNPGARDVLHDIKRYGLTDRIINVGRVDQSQLASFFRHCQAMFLPTFLESFSGTYLEAMHFGTPIITSNLDFAHVVCGDAALYFDPWNPESMKDAILKLKNSPKLPDELASNGKKRLESMFKSWDEIAADLMKLLAEIASGPSD